jgi:glycosyltransferase involved in cell wall biosynthesis
MKLAIVDHVGNPGGGSRYLRILIPHLLKLRPHLKITFFGNADSIQRERLDLEWKPLGIEFRNLNSLWLLNRRYFGFNGAKQLVKVLQHRYAKALSWFPCWASGAVHKELERKIKGFDLAFFPWPYFLRMPQISCPSVAVFHDFNFRYLFSGSGFSSHHLDMLHRDIPHWLQNTTPIVSTQFIQKELEKFYPERRRKPTVIPLAPMSGLSTTDPSSSRLLLKRFNLPPDYVLYPTNISPHKNLGPLFSAFHLLRQRGWKIPLVVAGYGTEAIYGKSCEIGLQACQEEQRDIIGLGYVENKEIDALIQCARAVVSTSLYEAGNGPGLDAWGKKVPVAMSKIPPFLEHLDFLGVTAKLFDPRSPQNIADRLEEIFQDPVQAKADAESSAQAISRWTWDQVAEKYLSVFEKAAQREPENRPPNLLRT